MTKQFVLLSNLTCPTCAADLEKALRRMQGVEKATVTFATGGIELEFDEDVVKPEQIDRTIEVFGLAIASRM